MSIPLDIPVDQPAPRRQGDARRDRWGRYLIVPPNGGREVGYTRATTIAKTLDDGGGLIPWKATATMVGALRRPGLHARWQALVSNAPDPWYASPESKAECKKLVEECATAGGSTDRADLGTALHSLTELVDLGQPLTGVAPELQRDLDVYTSTIRSAGIVYDLDLVEAIVINDTMQYSGTADRLAATLPDGRRVVADLKTGTSLDYSWQAIAIQLAAYARAEHRYVQHDQGGERLPMPELDPDVGLVIHLPAGEARCELHLVDLAAGWEALERSIWTREWRKAKTLAAPYTAVPAATTEPDRRTQLLARYAALSEDAQRRFKAQGVPKDDLDAIERALDEVDAFQTVAPLTEPKPPAETHQPRMPVAEADKLALIEHVRASNVKDIINAWVSDGKAAGHPWNVMASPYVDNWERTRAALRLAVACSDDAGTSVDLDCVRELLRAAIGDPAGEWPAITVGSVIGQLTIEQARHAANLADAFGTLVLPIYTDDGEVRLSGVERVAA